MKSKIYLLLCIFFISCTSKNVEQWWPQFRGPNGSGLADLKAKPPVEFKDKNKLWEIYLPLGFSSPIVWEDKIFLTGSDEDKKQLFTICLNRQTGKILWKGILTPDTLENHHPISNNAQNSMVTDGENVISCFGSFGLICYDMKGFEKWRYLKSCSEFKYGIASSPVISGNLVIFVNDDINDRYLLALNKTNGEQLWKTNFSTGLVTGQGGQATPCIYMDMIIVHIQGEVAAYSIKDGSLIWRYKVITEAVGTPIVVGENVVVNTWYSFTESDEQPPILPEFSALIKDYDYDKNSKISKNEFPDDLILFQRSEILDIEESFTTIKNFWSEIDANQDGYLNPDEWRVIIDWRKEFSKPSGLIAIKTSSKGDLTESDIIWRVTEKVSEVPSPIFYNNRIYMIKDGGFLTCINPETGNILYQRRIGSPGAFIASPVAANGLIYLIGYSGKLTVIKTGDEFKVISQHDFKDNIGATPAIIGNVMYIRTNKKLYAFSN